MRRSDLIMENAVIKNELFSDAVHTKKAFGTEYTDIELDAADAARRTAHDSRVALVKACAAAVVRGDNDLVFAVRMLDERKLVAFVEIYRYLAAFSLVLEVFHVGAFDDAAACDHYEVFVLA